jgi:hypothetical protein
MCKSPGDESIWVALKRWNWNWYGCAKKNADSTFYLESHDMDYDEQGPSDIDLPNWNGYVPASN